MHNIYSVNMDELRFEWDKSKNEQNQKKHGVSFEEAQAVFFDENAIQFYDDAYSEQEDRFLLLGISARLRILLICHCFRDEESVIRIISARRATKSEQQFYPGIRR